jgi:hypothetical protein
MTLTTTTEATFTLARPFNGLTCFEIYLTGGPSINVIVLTPFVPAFYEIPYGNPLVVTLTIDVTSPARLYFAQLADIKILEPAHA